MPWNTPSTADVLAEFTPQEQSALQTIQGSTQSLQAILDKAVAAARGSILAGGNELGADSLPDQLITEVIAIARWRWLSSLSGAKALQTEARKGLYEAGVKALAEVAAGRVKVERPAVAIPTTGDLTQYPAIKPRWRQTGWRAEDGL